MERNQHTLTTDEPLAENMDRRLTPSPWWRRYALHAVAAVVVLAVGIWLIVGLRERSYRAPLNQLTVAAVTRGPFEDYIAVRGTAAPGDLARDKILLDGNALAPAIYQQEQEEYTYELKLGAATAAASLDALTIRTPTDGQLTALTAEVGQSKAQGTVLGQVDSLDRLSVRDPPYSSAWPPQSRTRRSRGRLGTRRTSHGLGIRGLPENRPS